MKQTLIKLRDLVDTVMHDDNNLTLPEMAKLKFDLDALIAGMKAKDEPTIYNRLIAVAEEVASVMYDADYDASITFLEDAHGLINRAADMQYKYDTAESDPDTDRAEWERDQV